MDVIRFLTLEEVIKINKAQVKSFGGLHGIRDQGLLESAIYDAQASFGGKYLHKDIYHMAAAYAYGIIKNHAFIDGNKRAGIVSSLVFLQYNECTVSFEQDELYELGIAIATSKISINKIAATFKKHEMHH